MRVRLVGLGALAGVALWVLTGPAAHAFSLQGADGTSASGVPKFDLDEQMRNFRTGGATSSPTPGKGLDTPFGNGTLQFGVQQGPVSNFMTPGSAAPMSRNSAADFNRVVTPDSLR